MSDELEVEKPSMGIDDVLGSFGDIVNITISEPVAKKRGRAANDTFDPKDIEAAFAAAQKTVLAREDFAKLDNSTKTALTAEQVIINLATVGYSKSQMVKAISFRFQTSEREANSMITKVKANHLNDCIRQFVLPKGNAADKYCRWAVNALHKYQKGTLELVKCDDDLKFKFPSKYRVSSTDTVWGTTMLGHPNIELREKQLAAVRETLSKFKDKTGAYIDGAPLTEEQKALPNMLKAEIQSEAEKFWKLVEKAEMKHREVFTVQRQRGPAAGSGVAFDTIIDWDGLVIE